MSRWLEASLVAARRSCASRLSSLQFRARMSQPIVPEHGMLFGMAMAFPDFAALHPVYALRDAVNVGSLDSLRDGARHRNKLARHHDDRH
jgi:hypothetical protein